MERMNFVMGNVCDRLDRVERHGSEAGTSTQDVRKVGAEPKANSGSRAESDTIQERSNSDFDVKCATIQFYGNSHNSQSDRWIGLKLYMQSPDMLSYLGLKFQNNRISGRHQNTGQQRPYEFCYLLPFDLWTSYLARILLLKGCGSLFWESPISTKIFNGLQHSF